MWTRVSEGGEFSEVLLEFTGLMDLSYRWRQRTLAKQRETVSVGEGHEFKEG